jgi:hypothetical protein
MAMPIINCRERIGLKSRQRAGIGGGYAAARQAAHACFSPAVAFRATAAIRRRPIQRPRQGPPYLLATRPGPSPAGAVIDNNLAGHVAGADGRHLSGRSRMKRR